MIIVVMGVTGCGKTTVGKLLAEKLQIPFFDADHFHSEENIHKMKSGIPLSDVDREPWLIELAILLTKMENVGGCVLACSALREKYRTKLQESLKEKIRWIHLYGSPELISTRLKNRTDHFMSHDLLMTQFDVLERPTNAISISIENSPDTIIKYILDYLK